MRDSKSDQTSTMHQYCIELLIRQIDPQITIRQINLRE